MPSRNQIDLEKLETYWGNSGYPLPGDFYYFLTLNYSRQSFITIGNMHFLL